MKGISDSYWLVTRAQLKCEGQHGKAWGKLVWKGATHPLALLVYPVTWSYILFLAGKTVSPREERIPGGLKYTWKQGVSRGQPRATSEAAAPRS